MFVLAIVCQQVQYVDYGLVENIPVVHVYPMLLCDDVPQLCMPCQLHGVNPVRICVLVYSWVQKSQGNLKSKYKTTWLMHHNVLVFFKDT